MSRRLVSIALSLAASVGTVTAVAWGLGGCKQGEGGQCQVNTDCTDGLICRPSDHTCATTSSGIDAGPDAEPAPDADIDATPIDAMPIDATPIDAMPIDA